MTRTASLEWPIDTWPNSNSDRRKHWTRQRREARAIRSAAAKLALTPATGPVRLTFTFAFPDRRRRDLDNYSVKAYIDGLVDSRAIAADDHQTVTAVTRTLDPERTERGRMRVTVTIEEVD